MGTQFKVFEFIKEVGILRQAKALILEDLSVTGRNLIDQVEDWMDGRVGGHLKSSRWNDSVASTAP